MRNSTIPTAPQRIRHWAIAAIAAIVAAVWVTMSLIVPSLADNSSPSPATPATAKAQEVALHPTVRAPQGLTEGFYLGLAKEPASQPSMMVLPKGGGSLTTPSFRLQLTRPGQSAPASALCADPETESSTENNSTYVVSARDKSIVGFVNLDNAVQQKYVAATPNNRDADAELQKQYQALSALYDKNPAPTGYSNFENLVWQAVVWKMYYGMSVDERIPAGSGSSKGLTPGHFAIDLANAEKFTDKVNELHKQAVEDAKDLQTNKEMLDSIKLTIADGEPGHKLVKLDGSPQAVKAMNDALETKLNPEPADLGITITVDGKEPIKGTVKQALNGGIDVPLECGPSNTVKMTAQWNGKILLDGIFSGHADYKTQAGKNTQTKVVLGSETVPLTASQTFDALCAVPSSEDNPPVVRTTAAAADGTKNVVVDQDTTITDTVDLSDLVPGTSYQLTGKLIDKATGQPVTGVAEPKSEAFTAKATTDTQTMTFNVPAKSIGAADADKQYVVFEYLTQVKGVPPADSSKDNTVVARHESKDDEAQTVTVPKWAVPPEIQIQTQAKTPTPLKAGEAGEIVDDVTMAGLVKDQSYTLKGTLMDKATKQPVPGVDVVTSQPFVAKGETAETQPMTFKLPAEAVKGGATYVVFEELFDSKNNSVAEHKEIDSPEQSVTIEKPQAPTLTVKTTASTPTPLEVGKAGTVVDKVDMTGLVKDAKYTLTGTLVDQTTGEPVPGAKAEPKEFTAEGDASTQTMEFSVPAEAVVADKSFVVFETLTPASPDQPKVDHADKNDKAQTVTVPKPDQPKTPTVKTNATNKADDTQVVDGEKDATIVDKVTMTNLVKGTQYKLTGTLVDQTGIPVEGVAPVESEPFEATGEGEEVQSLEFTIPAKVLGSKDAETKYVVFEELTQVKAPEGGDASKDGTVVADHKDVNDEAQTVTVPKWAVPPEEPEYGGFDVSKVVKAPEGVTAPESYAFTYTCGEGDEPAADAEWTDLTVTPGDAGKQTVDKIPAGQTCWLREKAADIEGTTHAVTWTGNGTDLKDEKGTVSFPIEANASFAVVATNTYTLPTPGKVTVSKAVEDNTSKKLAADKSFTFPYVCATGEGANTKVADGTLKVAVGKPASITDVPLGTTCVISEADAAIDGTNHAVAWTIGGTPATPSDITWGGVEMKDAVQTRVVEAGAEAQVAATNTYTDKGAVGFSVTKNVTGADSALLKDQQFAFHYVCGDKTGDFQLKGGETFSSIEQKLELTAGTQCTVTEQKPADVDGVTFEGVTFDRVSGEGDFTSSKAESSLTFTLTGAGDPQTFRATNSYKPTEQPKTPEAKTVLGTVDGGKEIDAAKVADGTEVELVDTVSYANLKADTEYVAEGNITTAAGEATAFATFTTGHGTEGYANGDVKVTFKVPAAMVTGSDKLTAFERIWEKSQVTIDDHKVTPKSPNEIPVAKHEVPDDKDQTVTIKPKPDTPPVTPTPKTPEVSTSAGVPGGAVLVPGQDGTVVDKVTMTDLTPGTQYKVTGVLMDKATNTEVAGVTSEPVTFTADAATKVLDMTFHVPGSAIKAGSSLVVFETLTQVKAPEGGDTSKDNQPVAKHHDIDDHAQTVTIPKPNTPVTPPKVSTRASVPGGAVLKAGEDGTIVDLVMMRNLTPGTEYTVTGVLMDKATNAPVPGVTSEPVTFTAEAANETVEVTFHVPGDQIKDEASYVVFETLTQVKAPDGGDTAKNNQPVAEHKDINDRKQTVTVPKPGAIIPELPSITTTAAGDGLKHGQALPAGVDAVINDQVLYNNFKPGHYVVVGEVMDKSTGKVVPGSRQLRRAEFEVKGEADASGSLVVTFHVPASQMRPGAQFVIFERVYRAEDVKGINGLKPGVKPIVEDVDLANASETVVVAMAKTKGTTPVTPVPGGGTTTTHTVWHRMLARTGASAGLVGGVACAVIVAGCGLVLLRRRDA